MAGVFMCPKTCGFARIVALGVSRDIKPPRENGESSTRYHTRVKEAVYNDFTSKFESEGENFNIDFGKFTKNLPTLKSAINKWNFRKLDEKRIYLNTFSYNAWQKLSDNRKSEHTFANCKGCALRYTKVQALFPVKSNVLKVRAMKNPVFCAETVAPLRSLNGPAVTPTQKDIRNTAKAIYNKVSPVFEAKFNVNLAEALSKVPELDIERKSKNNKRQRRRSLYRNSKKAIEQQMEDTAFLRCYGGGESLRGWQRKRLALSFEPKSAAKKRKLELEPTEKSHCANFQEMEWDKEGLKAEVESYEDNKEINWSELARNYAVKDANGNIAGNGGQVVKEWLKFAGVNINRFKRPHERSTDSDNIRRKKRRGAGGEITVPTEVTPERLREMAREKVESGEYTIGERIVPKKYEKLVLTKDLKVKKSEFVAEGRKVPLDEIRAKTLREQVQFMRADKGDEHYNSMTHEEVVQGLMNINEYERNKHLNSEQLKQILKQYERHRHLMVWHDTSTVANHGHLVCLVSVLYDKAFFLTNEEYKAKTGKTVDVQTLIEKPEVHFIARSQSSDAEQLAYVDTRLSCINGMKNNLRTVNGNEIMDTLRFFHGDSPARQFESGQQKGGHYFCSNCGCNAKRAEEICHVLNCPLVSLQDRIDKIMEGNVARANTIKKKVKPLQGLSKAELQRELDSRGIHKGDSVKELQGLLDSEMKGIQRVPALLVNNPTNSLADFGLQHYEILPTEPLHDVGHHIENVLTELPHHLSTNEKEVMEDIKDMCFGGKDSKRGVDYRAALIKLTSFLMQNNLMSEKPLLVLQTLTEMQRILYASEENRNCSLVLRYYNQSWLHAILLRDLMSTTKKLTSRKMFGVYYHNLTSHGGAMLRLVSGQSAHAEEEECIFTHVKSITNTTTNYSPDHLIPNIFLRLQAGQHLKEKDDVTQQQHLISTLARSLPEPSNTRIPIELIKKHRRHWQAHLQNISDFIVEGSGVWWEVEDGMVEFHDVSELPNSTEHGPQLHHFRSSTLKEEELYLKQCWEKCIEQNISIPLHLIHVDLPNGKNKKIHTTFLGDPLPPASKPAGENPSKASDCQNVDAQDADEEDSHTMDENVIGIVPSPEEIVPLPVDHDHHQISSTTPLPEHSRDSGTTSTCTGELVHNPPSLETCTAPKLSKQPCGLKSCLGKALAEVFGQTEEVEKFDREHTELKENRRRNGRISRHTLQRYQDNLACLQVKVLAENSAATKKLQEWEKSQILKNNFQSPSYEDMLSNETAGPLLKNLSTLKLF